MKIYSVDFETNGLQGQAFCGGVVIYDTETKEMQQWSARCPIAGSVNDWVAENVLPQIEGIAETHNSYDEFLSAFAEHYMANKEGAIILAHVAFPVESRVFLDIYEKGFIGDWDSPFPLTDCSAIPEIGTSVDSYNADNNIVVPDFEGGTHNPLYDAAAAALAYTHWLENR